MGCRKLSYYENTTAFREASPLKVVYKNPQVCRKEKPVFREVGETLEQGGGSGRTIIYQRTTATDNSTIGNFSIPGTDINGYFLEPAGPSTTTPNLDRRIPAGTYNLEWNTGPRYPNALRLYNDQVPRSRAILIHIGNYPGDTQGCLLPGCSTGTDAVWRSGPKFNQVINHFNTIGIGGARMIIYDPINP